jgi:hypothetical protein
MAQHSWDGALQHYGTDMLCFNTLDAAQKCRTWQSVSVQPTIETTEFPVAAAG